MNIIVHIANTFRIIRINDVSPCTGHWKPTYINRSISHIESGSVIPYGQDTLSL